MDYEILVPAFNEGDESAQGTVIGIPLVVGDEVNEGDIILEIETDKVTVEVPCTHSGVISQIHVALNDHVGQGVHCFTVTAVDQTAVTAIVPEQIQATINLNGMSLNNPQPTVDVVNKINHEIESKQQSSKAQVTMVLESDVSLQRSAVPAGPSTRRLARELGIDIVSIPLNEGATRLSTSDVKANAKLMIQSGNSVQALRAATPDKLVKGLPDVSRYGNTWSEKLSKIAIATSNNMSNAWSAIPHAWLQEKVDITELEEWRQAQKKEGIQLTITVLIAKAIAVALKQFPKMNSSFDEQAQCIIFKEYIDVGIAVDTPHGLMVPSLRGVDCKRLLDLSSDIRELSQKANERKLTPDDLQGSGITLSNLGGIGLSSIFPIVNWPQVAIIGVAGSELVPKLMNNELSERRMVTLTLGFDHRIINGAEGARFLVHIKDLLEDIRRLVI